MPVHAQVLVEGQSSCMSRVNKKQGCAVITNDKELDIINVVKKSKAYDSSPGLSVKEKAEQMTGTGGDFITRGEVASGGLTT